MQSMFCTARKGRAGLYNIRPRDHMQPKMPFCMASTIWTHKCLSVSGGVPWPLFSTPERSRWDEKVSVYACRSLHCSLWKLGNARLFIQLLYCSLERAACMHSLYSDEWEEIRRVHTFNMPQISQKLIPCGPQGLFILTMWPSHQKKIVHPLV